MSKATDTQEGGTHYSDRAIQPIEYIHANELDFLSGNIVKYATRWPHKGQALSDLRKVIHYAELLIELEGLDGKSKDAEPVQQFEAKFEDTLPYESAYKNFVYNLENPKKDYETR